MTEIAQTVKYGFGGRLSESFPSQIIIDVTEVCNLACIHCPHPEFKKSHHYAGRFLEPELNAKMVDEVRDHGRGATHYIRYTAAGEPLAHPAGYDLIQYAVENSGTYVTITTNGTIMNEKRTQKLLDAGVHMIDISIDAFKDETYAQVRVNGDLRKTRSNVQRLLQWVRESGNKTKVVVSYVEQPQNTAETKDFESFWKDQGADAVVIRRLHSAAGAVIPVADLMRKKNSSVDRRPCVYPWERIVLTPRGTLAFCPADWSHGSTFADYRETTLAREWHGGFLSKLRTAHLSNDFNGFDFCAQCPDWSAIRWPSEGRAYADLVADMSSGD